MKICGGVVAFRKGRARLSSARRSISSDARRRAEDRRALPAQAAFTKALAKSFMS